MKSFIRYTNCQQNILFYFIVGISIPFILAFSSDHHKQHNSDSAEVKTSNSLVEESWDGPVQTVEREESLTGQKNSLHQFQEDDRFDETEHIKHINDINNNTNNSINNELNKNRVDSPKKPMTVTKNEPASASRFGVASAVVFTVAILLILEL